MDRRRFLRGVGVSGLAAGAIVATGATPAAASWGSAVDVTDPAYGATGNGTTDDTAAIQAAVSAAGPQGTVFFPKGVFKVSATINLLKGQQVVGEGSGGLSTDNPAAAISVIDFHHLTSKTTIFKGPPNNEGARFADLAMLGRVSGAQSIPQPNWAQGDFGQCAIDPGSFASVTLIENVHVFGASTAIGLRYAKHIRIINSSLDNQRVHGIVMIGGLDIMIHGCRFANAGGDGWDSPTNLLLGDPSAGGDPVQTPAGIRITDCFFDECYDWTAYVESGRDVVFDGCHFLYANGKSGPRVGLRAKNVTLSNCTVQPFSNNVAVKTLRIDSGALDTSLVNLTTNPNGGGDIDDQGTRTVFGNVNGAGFGAAGTVTKTQIQESSQIGNVSATTAVGVFIARGPCQLKGYRVSTQSTIAASTSKYWTIRLEKRPSTGGAPTIVGQIDTKAGLATGYAPFGPDVDIAVAAGDTIYFTMTRVGTAAALNTVGLTLFWNPA